MAPSKKRSASRSSPRRRISKAPSGTRTAIRRRYWFRGEPCTHPVTPYRFRATPVKRSPLYPHLVYAERLAPFRPNGTLGEALERKNALEHLRGLAISCKGDASAHYYLTALQGEVLGAPLKAERDGERMILNALPDRMYLNFSKLLDAPVSHRELTAAHPLEAGALYQATEPCEQLPKSTRSIPKTAYKVLDAPELKDDFYCSLIDWSSSNVLGVGLGPTVYLWRAANSQVEELIDADGVREEVTSVSWSQGASALAVGRYRGSLQLWDPQTQSQIIQFKGNSNRVGSLSWNISRLASGCRDGCIRYYDHRCENPVCVMIGHPYEICGLKWSKDNIHLAAGGNNNIVNIWDIRRTEQPLWQITEHQAAVKALSWSPHNSKYLATGGGIRDTHIKVWNLNKMERVMSVNASAQVCGLHWSENVDEIVSVHGFHGNAIQLWKASTMECIGAISGHSTRVIHLTTSPNGQSIATGSGDESIRFYRIFPDTRRNQGKCQVSNRDKLNMHAR